MSTAGSPPTETPAVNTGFRPIVGRTIRVSVIRLVMAAVMVALCFTIIGWQPLVVAALFLSVATLVFPKTPAAWALAALLAVFALGAFGAAPEWKFFVVLAGAQALHLFGMTLSWLPVGGPIQLRVVGRLLRPYLIIQVPAQLVSFAVLTVLSGRSVVATLTSPIFGLVAAIGFVLLVVFVIVPTLRGEE
ncbi:MAG: hypothetical protein QOK08_1660 [Actinomycetota bacterium]|nr:hypothetical protein [Actinomycetota bacterium]MDQ1544022.1 hypothetical protein [Actinomycetota bacterium]MDQ1562000.1 hypothetical protein [Actinomycetota bacterium]MDQ1563994.1 hypothetical protein [Actinomycetota bacterium]